MAYDIGQGISDALGSIGEGLVTRKERREERDKLIGQYEAIEEFKYKEYQDLLNKGAGENVVKAAQTEYEKWAKRGDELADEPTKKIEGIIAEYDKGESRKSRRLQNRMAELQIEHAQEVNPVIAKQKQAEYENALNQLKTFNRKESERKRLAEFPKELDAYLNKPVQTDRPEMGVSLEERTTMIPPKPEDMYSYLNPEGVNLYKNVYRPMIEKGDINYYDLMASDEMQEHRAGRAVLGPEGYMTTVPYAENEDPGIPMAASLTEGRRNVYSKVPTGAEAEFYSTPFIPKTRQPTADEKSQRAQEFLTQQSTQLGPENRAIAEKFVQSRFPRDIPGARITLDGEDTGKYIAGGQVLSERQQQNLMGIDSAPKGTYFKGLQGVVDPENGQIKYTYNYGIGEDPRAVGFVEDAVKNYSDLTFKSKLASSEQEAKDFRTLAADAEHGSQIIDEVLAMDDEMGFFSRRVALPLDSAARAKVQSKLNVLRGKLRLAIIGPGAVSEYEQKILEQVIGNPTQFFQINENARARLESLKSMMLQGMKFKGHQIGIWDYNHKMKAGAKKSDKRRTDYTPQELEDFDQNIAGRNVRKASDIPRERAFNSAEQANASGLPSGTTVFVKDPARRALVEYLIP